MKRYFIFFAILILFLSNYPLSALTQINDVNSQKFFIYQISPQIDKQIKTSYAIKVDQQTCTHVDLCNRSNYDCYVILTIEPIANEIKSSSFITWKQSLGYKMRIVNITDSLIQEQSGNDLPEKIRNFLREYHSIWGINSLLIIGNIDTIPMRYCYPNPQNHNFDIFDYTSGEVPTDYYYADLSSSDPESWDSDGDGFYGEYTQDQPDFFAEITVGRIPINTISRIIYTLEKTVSFEQDTSAWKHHALHAGAFFYFTDEITGHKAMDGAVLSNQIEQDIMNNWTISHYSEQEGIEQSKYNWPALNEQSFISDWRNNKYSIVNWQGHGWTDKVARKVWKNDDGDNKPEGNEILWPNFITRYSSLDDDYPSIVTAESCYVGCPEIDPNAYGNLGIDLLTDPSFGASVAVVASARSPYGSSEWPSTPGGSDQIIYEFNKNIITKKQSLGEALYNSKYHCNAEFGWDNYAEYIDMFTFNLYGDPTLHLIATNGNHAPNKPEITGPSFGKIGNEYTFYATSTDPDDDQIRYIFDWGEEKEQWTDLYDSGETCNASHTWSEKGSYEIKVKSKDSHDAESEWSEPLKISMPKAKYQLLFDIIKEKKYMFQSLGWLSLFRLYELKTMFINLSILQDL